MDELCSREGMGKKKEEYFKKKREKQKERLKKFGDSHKVKPLKYGNTN